MMRKNKLAVTLTLGLLLRSYGVANAAGVYVTATVTTGAEPTTVSR